MNYETYLERYSSKKESMKDFVRHMMKTRSAYFAISDLVPVGYKAEKSDYFTSGIRIVPSDPNKVITADEFDGLAYYFARKLNIEPYKNVTEYSLNASFEIFLRNKFGGEGRGTFITIVLQTENSEKCDFIPVEKTITNFEPTGYCKQLKDKMYLEKSN